MKLYVWYDVLSDYTSGVAFALAESPEHARQLILATAPEQWKKDIIARALADEPTVHDTPMGYALFGGG